MDKESTQITVKTYPDASRFLERTQSSLVKQESANNLILGISLRLACLPERIKIPPFLGTVEDECGALRLAAVMTPPQRLVLGNLKGEPFDVCHALALHLLENRWQLPGVIGPNQAASNFCQAWQEISGQSYHIQTRERAYELTRVNPTPHAPGRFRQAVSSDLEPVKDWWVAFNREVFGPEEPADVHELHETATYRLNDQDVFLWDDGGPVSMAVRTRPTLNGISVGDVYTPPEWRGRGYATSCVAALSQLLLDSGRKFCNLFTDLDNPTSNSIYQKIGYVPVCDFMEYNFSPVP